MNNLNESPSDLIFKQKAIKYGPGEKKMINKIKSYFTTKTFLVFNIFFIFGGCGFKNK